VPAIGLDLGASKAVMAVLAGGEPRLIPNREHSPLTPAALALDPQGGLVWGHDALASGEGALEMWLPRLGEAASLALGGLEYTPEELAALFFDCLRQEAEAHLGQALGRVVLATPLAFGQRQLALLRQAAHRAGLFVLSLVPSTLAAGLAYAWEHPTAEPHTMLVADFGAGSLGVALLRTFPGALTVLGQAGNRWLGGEDFTQAIVAHLLRRLQAERGLLLDETQAARRALRRRLRRTAEAAKVALSTVEQVRIALAPEDLGLKVGLDEVLRRNQFEGMAEPWLAQALETVERALAEAGLSPEGVDAVLLAGAASRMPFWQAELARRLRRARFLRDFNPLTGTAMGAALWAALVGQVRCPTCGVASPREATACPRCGSRLSGEARLACPRCFVPNRPEGLSCHKCGTSLRAARQRAGAPLARAWSGDEGLRCHRCGLVAPAGAGSCPHCGSVVAPFVGGLSRYDVGLEGDGGRMDVVLPRGRGLPTQPAWRVFASAEEGELLEVPLYEGDKPVARRNERCGTLRVELPADGGSGCRVRVGFGFDADGLLEVRAEADDGSGHALDAWLEWAP